VNNYRIMPTDQNRIRPNVKFNLFSINVLFCHIPRVLKWKCSRRRNFNCDWVQVRCV